MGTSLTEGRWTKVVTNLYTALVQFAGYHQNVSMVVVVYPALRSAPVVRRQANRSLYR